MADTNDTIDGLLAEFRGYAAGMPPSYHVTMSWADFRRMLDRLEAAHKRESDEMLDALVRIGNWCAQDLAENAFIGDASGNYEKTLHGLCEVCRPFMQKASKLKRYGGANG